MPPSRAPGAPADGWPLPDRLHEGRISHLKHGYHLRRSRLKGDQGQRIWTGGAIPAYNLDTLALHNT